MSNKSIIDLPNYIKEARELSILGGGGVKLFIRYSFA